MPAEYKTGSVRASTLEKETRIVIEEARMVLPGIQALFGFQLIAIFNNRFQSFSRGEQSFHLLALLLVAIAVALIMTPAAYHRIGQRGILSRRFIDLALKTSRAIWLPNATCSRRMVPKAWEAGATLLRATPLPSATCALSL